MKWLAPLIALVCAVMVFGSVSMYPQDRIVSAFATNLAGRTASQRHNSELALRRLIGATIAPGATFSFNDRVGTYSRDRGYRRAPVSYDGQLVKDWGGGVCQTSTTLYNAALLAGMTIVERNHHRFCPSYIDPGRDAAVAFSSVDLRFTNPYPFPVRIEGRIEGDRLLLEFHANRSLPVHPQIVEEIRGVERPRVFRLGPAHGAHRVRNTGKFGCEVVISRVMGDRREEISHDVYPAMNRVVD